MLSVSFIHTYSLIQFKSLTERILINLIIVISFLFDWFLSICQVPWLMGRHWCSTRSIEGLAFLLSVCPTHILHYLFDLSFIIDHSLVGYFIRLYLSDGWSACRQCWLLLIVSLVMPVSLRSHQSILYLSLEIGKDWGCYCLWLITVNYCHAILFTWLPFAFLDSQSRVSLHHMLLYYAS